jgi:hypothetical protein
MPPRELDRRTFLKLTGATGVVAMAAPALLLDAPKELTLTVTKGRVFGFGYTGFDAINDVTRKHIVPGVVDQFFKTGPMMAYVKNTSVRELRAGELVVWRQR